MEKSLNNKLLESLHEEYPDIHFIIKDVNLVGEIAVIAGLFQTEQLLQKKWENLSSSVCSHYQINLDNDFTKWNTYLIYVCNEPVEKGLKYLIENDKFSNRKVVVQLGTKNFDEPFVDRLISEKISLDKLKINPDIDKTKVSRFWEQSSIADIILSFGTDSKGELESFEKTLSKIETHLKDENS